MSYVTIYTHTFKRGKRAGITFGYAYQTKTLTPHHAALRLMYPDAQTYENPRRVITDFVTGMNLRTLPIVSGGVRIA